MNSDITTNCTTNTINISKRVNNESKTIRIDDTYDKKSHELIDGFKTILFNNNDQKDTKINIIKVCNQPVISNNAICSPIEEIEFINFHKISWVNKKINPDEAHKFSKLIKPDGKFGKNCI